MEVDKKPELSVILPVYNAEKYVAQAIESILNQTFTDFELIIADDGSKDKSREIVDAYASQDERIILSHNSENQGKVKTVNRLFKQCRGTYVTIHDADDWSELRRFEIQISVLEKSEHILCGTSFRSVNENGECIDVTFPETNYEIIKKNIAETSQFHGPTIIFERETVSKVGGLYRYPFLVAEDIDFCERVTERFSTCNIPEVVYNYRLHAESLTKKRSLYVPERYALRDLLIYLRAERMKTGRDSIWGNKKSVEIDKKYKDWVSKWEMDYPTIYNDGIGRSVYFGFYDLAFNLSFEWVRREPFKFNSWKNLASLIWRYIKRGL